MKKSTNKKTTNKTQQNSNYDWFRGNVGNNKQLSPKEKAHKIWKIVRMFIYVFLAGLSLTGCIQSFVIKTPGNVGQGLEVYSKKEDVAPHVKTLKLMKNGALTQEVKEHYWLGRHESNEKIEKAKSATLDAIQKQIGGGYWSWITENNALRIVDESNNGLNDFNDSKGSKEKQIFNFQVNGKTVFAAAGEHSQYQLFNKYNFQNKLPFFFPTSFGEKRTNFTWLEAKLSINSESRYNKYMNGDEILDSLNKAYKANSSFTAKRSTKDWEDNNTIKKSIEFTNTKFVAGDETFGKGFEKVNLIVSLSVHKKVEVKFQIWENGKWKDYSNKLFENIKNKVASWMQHDQARILNSMIFDKYVSKLLTSKIYKEAETAFNNINNLKTKEDPADLAKIVLYQNNLNSLRKIFGLEKTEAFNADKTTKLNTLGKQTAQLSNGTNLFSFNQSSGNKQRAIYDWSRSWKLGPFYGMFVYPLSKLTLGISSGIPSESAWHGWEMILTLFLTVIIIRTFAYAVTFKSTLQQVKQQELSAKRAAIEAKYLQYKGNKQMEQRKRQEMSEMFKKEGISPLGSLGNMFLTMPIFLSMWKIIGGLPQFKSTNWLGINFASTSWRELIYNKGWQYLPLMIIAGVVQGLSIILPRILTKKRDKKRINAQQKEALKKANKTQNIMAIFFIGFAVIMSAGIQVYWIFGGLFTTGQNILNHFIIKKQSQKRKSRKLKSK